MIAECKCQHCENPIEFEVSEFQETGQSERQRFGQSVPCPHCQKETNIYIDKPEPPGGWPKQEPAQTIPTPKSEPPKKIASDPNPKPTTALEKSAINHPPLAIPAGLSICLQGITALAAIACAVMIYSISKKPTAPPSAPVLWEYAVIQWEPERFDHENHKGKILATQIHIATDRPSAAGAQAVDIDRLLTAIGDYGWELVCYDGKRYIVKRPRIWQDGSFYLTDEWQDLPKTK